DIRNTFADPEGRQMLADIEQGIRQSLDAGDKGIATKDSIEFLKSADPDAYARLARDYPQVFKDVVAPRPDLRAGSAASDMHALVQAGVDPKVAGRVNVVEVPGDSVRIRVKNGMLEVEVGRRAPTDAAGQAVLEGHLGSVRRLSRYVGPLGQVRAMIAKVGAALGFLTSYTRGGEAAEEITKLKDIRRRMEALRDESEGKLGRWAKDPAKISDPELDAEIARIQRQIDAYSLELGDTSVGKGYIAAEGNFAEIEKAGIIGKPLDEDALNKLGYRVDKNGVIYRPKGASATMEPLQLRDDGLGNKTVQIADYESPAAVQARVRESLPTTKQEAFDAMVKAAPPGKKVRLVEGVYDTGATWKEVFGSPTSVRGKQLRSQLRDILTKDAGLSADKADELINGLIDREGTIKIVVGTDPIRGTVDYRKLAGTTGEEIAHHFDPLYLGGGHDLMANLPTGAHDKVHRFFDELSLPGTAHPGGVALQPGKLQAAVRGTTKPAVVIVDTATGKVTYKLYNEEWK
ncbi:MAG TPA: hypothetical protein VLT45_00595, partial [Kofleriaceae bacterium]|nr:hypothetical protein [Kofleriaceae bacterium]